MFINHCGRRVATVEQVNAIQPPPATQSWRPISHGHVRETALEMLETRGWKAEREDYSIGHKGHVMFGVLTFDSIVATGVKLAIGLRNSTNKMFPAGLCAGDRVMVCDNLLFAGMVTVMHRHTVNILSEFPQRIAEGLARLPQFCENRATQIDRLRTTTISTDQARLLLTRMFEKGMLASAEFSNSLNEWHGAFNSEGKAVKLSYGGRDRQPRHPENDEPTLWKIQQAITESKKPRFLTNAPTAANETMDVNSYLMETMN